MSRTQSHIQSRKDLAECLSALRTARHELARFTAADAATQKRFRDAIRERRHLDATAALEKGRHFAAQIWHWQKEVDELTDLADRLSKRVRTSEIVAAAFADESPDPF